MQPMNYRKRVEDLEVEVRKLKSAKTECDCGEPMSQGQRRAIISTSGPFDPDRSTDYAPMAPPKNCAASWYDN